MKKKKKETKKNQPLKFLMHKMSQDDSDTMSSIFLSSTACDICN